MRKILIITGTLLLAILLVLGACAAVDTLDEDLTAELQNQITTLEGELSEKEATITAFQQGIQQKQDEITALENELLEKEATISTLQQEIRQKQNEIEELLPLVPQEETTTPPAQPEEEQVIEDLAYIKIFVAGYSDDADPEADGISLRITFYDSKSESITFSGIPVTVTIELYGYREMWDIFDHEKMRLVHQEQFSIDDADGFFGGKLKIPHENIIIDPNKYYTYGTMKVTVTTSEQGDFQDMWDLVRLYSED